MEIIRQDRILADADRRERAGGRRSVLVEAGQTVEAGEPLVKGWTCSECCAANGLIG